MNEYHSFKKAVPLKDPYIPVGEVGAVLVDSRADSRIFYSLEKMNIKVLRQPVHPLLMEPVASHPDMAVHPIGGGSFIVAPEMIRTVGKMLIDEGMKVIAGKLELGRNYPSNIAYNVARVGKNAFHYFAFTDPVLKSILQEKGIRMIHVKQGYSKCSVAVVNESAIITSDKGIEKSARENNLEVLLIQPGFILLDGFEYGFIGGCTGLISPDRMVFSGDLEMHPDGEKIQKFLKKFGIQAVSLVKGMPLTDIGTILPLWEKIKN